ncbi:polysaccharide deacetylase family protein [Streptomyces sp. NPDC001691]|uniref:polysaccharide deacetylase family protein n=1 Tax=unclassified Streptomyces TaxID=2593676 RepID=UPI001CB91D3C|nr:polysaccharide deacetylase family protein [Streptomyces sp. SDr-06]
MKRAHRLRAALAGLLAAGALLGPLAGCTEPTAPVDPFERLGRKAAQKVAPRAGPDTRAAARRWGLAAPLTPAPRPTGARPALPFVVDRVPVRSDVVFLTFDGGPGTDPALPRMVRDLKLPIALFLTGSVAAPGYDRVDALRALGAGVHNHTLHHPDLRTLGHPAQRAEICGQQDRLAARFGTRPHLFRPPYGAYDATTLRAARECGVTAVVLARATMTADGLRYAEGPHRLRPGDIVRAHLPGPGAGGDAGATRLTARILDEIEAQGLTVGRLEDYL